MDNSYRRFSSDLIRQFICNPVISGFLCIYSANFFIFIRLIFSVFYKRFHPPCRIVSCRISCTDAFHNFIFSLSIRDTSFLCAADHRFLPIIRVSLAPNIGRIVSGISRYLDCPRFAERSRIFRIINNHFRAYRAMIINPLSILYGQTNASMRCHRSKSIVTAVGQCSRILFVIPDRMKQNPLINTAAVLSVTRAFEHMPAHPLLNPKGSRRRYTAGRTRKCLDGLSLLIDGDGILQFIDFNNVRIRFLFAVFFACAAPGISSTRKSIKNPILTKLLALFFILSSNTPLRPDITYLLLYQFPALSSIRAVLSSVKNSHDPDRRAFHRGSIRQLLQFLLPSAQNQTPAHSV